VGFDQQGMQILDDEQCRRLLRSVRIGRIALTHQALPVILPVGFGQMDRDLYFHVVPGVLTRAAEVRQIVGFEADWTDDDLRAAWSVSIVGRLSLMADAPSPLRADPLEVAPWSSAAGMFLRLEPAIISGRARHLSQ
jgi:uncharacterized protein